ncbi:MAG: response regulator [Acidimicrobiia bacterium]|nr:response regulator [Acidimicrobiia bacterium]
MTEPENNDDLRFVAAVSHELRSPLHAVLGLSELLAGAELPPRELALADAIRQEAESMRVLVDDLLDLAKLNSHSIELRHEAHSPMRLVSGIVEAHRRDAAAKDLVLLFDSDAGVPRQVLGDQLRFGQVVRNLISNAIRYTDVGSVQVHLELTTDQLLCVSVSDTGIGIPPDRLEHVFDPFVRVHEKRAGGTGLGLAISRRLATALGGALDVTSTEGGGSTFVFTAPYEETRESRTSQISRLPSTQTGSVLVVEDSEVNRMLATSQLTSLGVEPIVVATAEDAYEHLSLHAVDVILMDWNLPGDDGLEATRRIRAEGLTAATTPIIAMTANALSGDRERCLEAGMTDFLAKPVGIDDLRIALEGHLDVGVVASASTDELEALGRELGDPLIVNAIVSTFLDELSERRKALVGPDAEESRRAAHTLKSTSSLLGEHLLSELCEQYEKVPLPAKDLLGRIDGEIEVVEVRFREYVREREVA